MRAKKSLGQHFLTARHVVAAIISAAELSDSDTVLEVGPGKGVLTEALLQSGARVVAVEKDDSLIPFLKEKFAGAIAAEKLFLVHDDILKLDLARLGLRKKKYKLIANIPYYITGQLFRLFLSSPARPKRMVLMVQKDVAKRIVARNTKESLLSVSVKAYGTPRYVKSVPAKFFSPAPKVDSAILAVEDIASPFRTKAKQDRFFAVARKGFAHKRKLLRNNLGCETAVLKTCNIQQRARAEDLSVDDWLCLSTHL